ncbi:MAG: hypothetical protein WBA74_09520 [Cyclobacteriaceae bacterium]
MSNYTAIEDSSLEGFSVKQNYLVDKVNKDATVGTDPADDPNWDELIPAPIRRTVTYKKYGVHSFYHPFVCDMIKEIRRKGVPGILDPQGETAESQRLIRQSGDTGMDFKELYEPSDGLILEPLPKELFDFDQNSTYGIYNWEIFFHIPLLVADRLSQNQKFEEAQQWYHYIFNPIQEDNDFGTVSGPARFWKLKPFFEEIQDNDLDTILKKLSGGADLFKKALDEWTADPFQPHAVARLRIVAYMKHTIIKYLDNMIAWGDYLFAQDSIESINEATQLYIIVSELLGKKPVEVFKNDYVPQSMEWLLNPTNVTTKQLLIENGLGELKTGNETTEEQLSSISSIMITSFCNTPNDKLLSYWDKIADRLFKIRNCQNIEGVTRDLALFQPPIDPALLVRASAAGIDIAQAVNNASVGALPYYRFRFLMQKSLELCNDVKSLGASFLSALEKKDAEQLATLRASQEKTLMKAVRFVRQQGVEESKEALASLESARELAEKRLSFYSSREFLNRMENKQLKKLQRSQDLSLKTQIINLFAAVVASTSFAAELGTAGISSPFVTLGKSDTGFYNAVKGGAEALSMLSQSESFKATKSGILGGYERRQDEWTLQADLAQTEIEQIDKQLIAAEIRIAMAEADLKNHDLQTQQSEEIERFMKTKFTNKQLYDWMTKQCSAMFFQSYQLALNVARMAERAFRYERAVESTDFIKFGHWDSLRQGLLSGEKLERDLRRMEVAFIEQNKREYEISKNISLHQLNPVQLLQLKQTGSCDFYLPEVIYDMDHPGQYMRRIKSVNLTIPCVTGPYTNVNAKLTLLSSFVRTKPVTDGPYPRSAEDVRFRSDYGSVQSIATSRAQNDAGLFELNFQDERYLPFEGAGAISSWRLELPDIVRQFDYDTIADVIIQVNYMAREGGNQLKTAAITSLSDSLDKIHSQLDKEGRAIVISMRSYYPNELYNLLNTAEKDVTLNLKAELFPYWQQGKTIAYKSNIDVLVRPEAGPLSASIPTVLTGPGLTGGSTPVNITDPSGGLYPLPYASFAASGNIDPGSSYQLTFDDATSNVINQQEIADVLLVITYTVDDPQN